MYYSKGGGMGIYQPPSNSSLQLVKLVISKNKCGTQTWQGLQGTTKRTYGPNTTQAWKGLQNTTKHIPKHHTNIERHHTSCGGNPRQTSRITDQQPNTPTPYMEQQVARFCQAHSINAYVGYHLLKPEDIMKTADKIHNDLTSITGNPTGILNIHYNKGSMPSNFSIPLLNYHLLHQGMPSPEGYLTSLRLPSYTAANPTTGPEQYPTGIHLGSTKNQITQLLGNHSAVLLHYTTTSRTGHAVCIKKYQDAWYLLDSEVGHEES